MPWLYQQGYHYDAPNNPASLNLHETFLLSVNKAVIETLNYPTGLSHMAGAGAGVEIKVGGIVVHGRDPELRKTTHHASDYMPAVSYTHLRAHET